MSDVFEGPGWWMASDGKWYEPERHPDPAYRERFLPAAVEETPLPTTEALEAESSEPNSLPDTELDVGVSDPEPMRKPIPEVRVGRVEIPEPVEARPVFDMAPPASVTAAGSAHDVQLEIGRPSADPEEIRALAADSMRAPVRKPTTAIVPIERDFAEPVTVADRIIATAIFLGGVAMIVGTFLNWVDGQLPQTGWERGDGVVTVLAGVVGSAAAGPIYVGFRHIVPKAAAIFCGFVGLVIVVLAGVTTVTDSAASNSSLGVGLFVVGVAALAMIAGGVADRGDTSY